MTKVQFNSFKKSETSKTGYKLAVGSPMFDKNIYMLLPHYVHGRSPAFSLVAKGKHLSGFYPTGQQGFFIGDHDKRALVLIQTGSGLDLFKFELAPIEARQMLLDGKLNDMMFQARREADSL